MHVFCLKLLCSLLSLNLSTFGYNIMTDDVFFGRKSVPNEFVYTLVFQSHAKRRLS